MGWGTHNSSSAPYRLYWYARFCTAQGDYQLGQHFYTMAYPQGPQAACYNGQSVHELGMSVNVLCTCPVGRVGRKSSGIILSGLVIRPTTQCGHVQTPPVQFSRDIFIRDSACRRTCHVTKTRTRTLTYKTYHARDRLILPG